MGIFSKALTDAEYAIKKGKREECAKIIKQHSDEVGKDFMRVNKLIKLYEDNLSIAYEAALRWHGNAPTSAAVIPRIEVARRALNNLRPIISKLAKEMY